MDLLGVVAGPVGAGLICAVLARLIVPGRGQAEPRGPSVSPVPDTHAMAKPGAVRFRPDRGCQRAVKADDVSYKRLPYRCRYNGHGARPAVGTQYFWAMGEEPVCEGCRQVVIALGTKTAIELWQSWESEPAYCECVCGHVVLATLDQMDRTGGHLRCPHCVAAGHPSAGRSEASFAADPRFAWRD